MLQPNYTRLLSHASQQSHSEAEGTHGIGLGHAPSWLCWRIQRLGELLAKTFGRTALQELHAKPWHPTAREDAA